MGASSMLRRDTGAFFPMQGMADAGLYFLHSRNGGLNLISGAFSGFTIIPKGSFVFSLPSVTDTTQVDT